MSGRDDLTDAEREALVDWWDSDWPDDGRDVLDTLAETVERIVAGRVRAAVERAAVAEAKVARAQGVLRAAEYAAEASLGRMFNGRPFPPSVDGTLLRAALGGDGDGEGAGGAESPGGDESGNGTPGRSQGADGALRGDTGAAEPGERDA